MRERERERERARLAEDSEHRLRRAAEGRVAGPRPPRTGPRSRRGAGSEPAGGARASVRHTSSHSSENYDVLTPARAVRRGGVALRRPGRPASEPNHAWFVPSRRRARDRVCRRPKPAGLVPGRRLLEAAVSNSAAVERGFLSREPRSGRHIIMVSCYPQSSSFYFLSDYCCISSTIILSDLSYLSIYLIIVARPVVACSAAVSNRSVLKTLSGQGQSDPALSLGS